MRKSETEMGRWVRAVREALGLTQEAFAEKIGSHVQTVAKWEGGERRNVRGDILTRILEIAPQSLRETCPVTRSATVGAAPVSATATVAMSGADRSLIGTQQGGYVVKTPEAAVVAGMLDEIVDAESRRKAMQAALEALSPSRPVAGSPARARR